MSDQPPRVLDAPESIWLNYGDLERDYSHAELAASGEVTWCEEAVFVSDVRYVRADLMDSLKAQRDELLEVLVAIHAVARVDRDEDYAAIANAAAAIASATKEPT